MNSQVTRQDAQEYLSAVLELYLQLPETPSRASSYDRRSAVDLHVRGVSMATIEAAFLLASLRRLGRAPDMPPLSPIRSLAYFFPVIDEILDNPLPEGYLEYLRNKLRSLTREKQAPKTL